MFVREFHLQVLHVVELKKWDLASNEAVPFYYQPGIRLSSSIRQPETYQWRWFWCRCATSLPVHDNLVSTTTIIFAGWYDSVYDEELGSQPCIFTSVTPVRLFFWNLRQQTDMRQAWNNINLKRLAEKIKSPLVLCFAFSVVKLW